MGAILFLLMAGLIVWGLWSLFVKSVVWVLEPITDYFEKRQEESDKDDEDGVGEKEEPKIVVDISSRQEDGSYKTNHMEWKIPNPKGGSI